MQLIPNYQCLDCHRYFERAPTGVCPICCSKQIRTLPVRERNDVQAALELGLAPIEH